MEAKYDFDLYINFICLNVTTILRPIEEWWGCSGGHWDGVPWQLSLMYKGMYGDLGRHTCICERVEFSFLNGRGVVLERSTSSQTSSLELDNTNTSSLLGPNLMVATPGIWIVEMLDSIVKNIVEAWIWDLKRPITLNEPRPKIHIAPQSLMCFFASKSFCTFLYLHSTFVAQYT